MTLWIALVAAGPLLAQDCNSDQAVSVLDIQEIEASFAEVEEATTQLVESLEVESKQSIDQTVDREMATILKGEQVNEEVMEEIAPQLEDLSHLAKRPAVTLAEPEVEKAEDPYETLPISVVEKQKISNILMTMAENNVFKLLFEKKRLEKLGRDINHIHPIRFLGTVFSDPRLVHCMYEIRRSGFKWDGFIDGFSQRFQEELRAGNVKVYIPGLAKSLGMKREDLIAYVNYSDFEGLVLYLMEKSRQQ